jgi:hypothetical protein
MVKQPFAWSIYGTIPPGSNVVSVEKVEQGSRLKIRMPVRLGRLRKGERIKIPTVSEAMLPLIGAAVAYWGDLELHLDDLLTAFVAADADSNDENWQRKNFRKRRQLLKQKVRARFPGRIATEVCSILDAATEYHWQRNLLVHGHYKLHIHGLVTTVIASGYHNGRYIEAWFEERYLEEMYHELGMLTGRFQDLTACDDSKCALSSRNRQRLRAFVRRHHLSPPTPERRRPRHPLLRA